MKFFEAYGRTWEMVSWKWWTSSFLTAIPLWYMAHHIVLPNPIFGLSLFLWSIIVNGFNIIFLLTTFKFMRGEDRELIDYTDPVKGRFE